MLEIKNLNFKLKDKIILNNINLKLKDNKITVMIGKNGSGKSTIIKAINRLIKYDGLINLDGCNILEYKSREKAQKIAILPQHLEIVPITVNDLVSMGRNPYLGLMGKLTDNDKNIVNYAINILDLNKIRNQFLNTLSGGELQKAYLAMMLAQDTQYLIFDEPTTFLDVDFEGYFLEKLKDVQNDKTILVVLHNITKAIEIADEIIIVDNGEIIYNDTKEKLLNTTIIEEIFNVKKYQVDNKIFYTK